MFKKLFNRKSLGLTSVVTLLVGVVSQLLGVDIAPTYVDALVTTISGSIAIYLQWKANHGK